MTERERRLAPLAGLFAATILLPAHAESTPETYPDVIQLDAQHPDDDAADRTQLDTVIVLGEKLGRSLRETSTSVEVIGADDLNQRGKLNLQDVLEDTVNVSAGEEGGLSIRGIDQTGASGGAGAPLISVQVDGVTLDGVSQESALETLFDVQQIEVLRGAQSTSQGRNALAGAVVVKSKDPTWSPDLYALARYGSLNTWQLGVAGGGPLNDVLAMRVALSHDHSDGFITHEPDGADDFSAHDHSMVRLKLLYESLALAGFRSLLNYNRSRTDGQPDYNMEKGTAGTDMRRTSTVNTQTRDLVTSELVSWDNRYTFESGWTLSAISALMRTEQDYIRDFDGTEEQGGSNPLYNDGDNLTQEIRLSTSDNGRVQGMLGLYAGRFRTRNSTYSNDVRIPLSSQVAIPILADALELEVDFLSQERKDADNLAAFFEFDVEVLDWLTATVGLRYDRETLDARNRFATQRAEAFVVAPDGLVAVPLVGLTLESVLAALPGLDVRTLAVATGVAPETNGFQGGKTSYSAWLPKLGLRAALGEHWSVFASYAEAYRAGGVDVDSTTGEAVGFDPEYTHNYELGVRGHWGQAVQLAANVFYVDWTDQQVPVPTGLFFVTQNAASSRLYGAEASLRWRFSPHWRMHLALATVDTKFIDYVDGENDYSGNRFVMAPERSANLWLVWEHPEGLMAALNVSHQSMAFTYPSNSPEDRSDARELVSLRIGYRRGQWAVYLTGRNLLDQDYITETYNFPDGYLGADSPRGYGAYGAPRTVSGTLEWQF